MQIIEITFADYEYKFFLKVHPFLLNSYRLVKTEMHKELTGVIARVQNGSAGLKESKGILIRGPKGTGKSSSLFYLKHILGNEIVLLISFKDLVAMKAYLEKAIQEEYGKSAVSLVLCLNKIFMQAVWM